MRIIIKLNETIFIRSIQENRLMQVATDYAKLKNMVNRTICSFNENS